MESGKRRRIPKKKFEEVPTSRQRRQAKSRQQKNIIRGTTQEPSASHSKRLANTLIDEIDGDEDSPEKLQLSSASEGTSSKKRTPTSSVGSPYLKTSNSSEYYQSLMQENCTVIKFLGRTVNIAHFTKDTPLYPICRAWVNNSPSSEPYSRTPLSTQSTSVKKKDQSSDNTLIDEECPSSKRNVGEGVFLPPPKPLPQGKHTLRIPSPPPVVKIGVDLNYENKQLPTKEELLCGHLKRWRAIRQKWLIAAVKNEERYEHSKRILIQMFKQFGEQV